MTISLMKQQLNVSVFCTILKIKLMFHVLSFFLTYSGNPMKNKEYRYSL